MKDAASVISQATDGIGTHLAKEYEISEGRMYEILGKDNPYPKTKVLIRKIGRVDSSPDKHRVRLIKADIDAMFRDILGDDAPGQITLHDIHREAFEAIDAMIQNKPAAECVRELRELVAVCEQKIEGIEKVQARSLKVVG